ncbi:MAG: DUF2157 domain-containing protein [Mycobacteriales bacterium]
MRTDIGELLEQWADRGLISHEQEQALERDLSERPEPDRQSLLREALGYAGGVLVLVAVVVLVGQWWDRFSDTVEVVLPAVATVLLVAAGAGVRDVTRPSAYRLRAALWLLSSVACTTALALFAVNVTDIRDVDVAVFSAAGAALLSAALYARHRSSAQQLALLVLLGGTAGAAAGELPADGMQSALAVWGVGVVWALLAWSGVVTPRRTGLLLGSVAAMVGALMGSPWHAGVILAVVTAALVLAAGVVLTDPVLLGVGAVASLESLPVAAARFLPGELAVPLALLAVGSGLVVLALRRREVRHRPAPSWAVGSRASGLKLAAAVGTATAAVALAVGLS